MNDPIWKNAPAYPLNEAWRSGAPHDPLSEGGSVKFAWDDHHLYVAATLDDSDIIVENDADNVHHYRTGDVLELFLKPPGGRHYWELYGTPTSRQSTFFYPSRGRMSLASCLGPFVNLKVAAKIDGTLNQWEDRDRGWSVVMAVPLSEITAKGDSLTADSPPWSVLVARYNHSAYHEVQGGELSSTSKAHGNTNFHQYEKWGKLRLVK